MDKDLLLKKVSDFRKDLENNGIKPERIVLFGSQITGFAGPESDIDLLVVSRDFAGKDIWERAGILSRAVYRASAAPIEAFAVTDEEYTEKSRTAVYFAEGGETIYEAHS